MKQRQIYLTKNAESGLNRIGEEHHRLEALEALVQLRTGQSNTLRLVGRLAQLSVFLYKSIEVVFERTKDQTIVWNIRTQ